MNGPAVWDKSDSESLWSEEEQDSLLDAPGLSCWQDKTTALLRIESSRLRQLKVLYIIYRFSTRFRFQQRQV